MEQLSVNFKKNIFVTKNPSKDRIMYIKPAMHHNDTNSAYSKGSIITKGGTIINHS